MDWFMHYVNLVRLASSGFSIILTVLDILILSAVIFAVYRFIKERRAGKLAWGVCIFFIFLAICAILNLRATQYILSSFVQLGVVPSANKKLIALKTES